MRNSDSQQLENYFNSLRPQNDALLARSQQASQKLGLQHISLGPVERAVLQTLVGIHRARKFVEIGTLTGASGLSILAGMPQGSEFWTFEKDPQHAEYAEPILNEAAAKNNHTLHLVLGDAQLRLFDIEEQGPFDGIFIDGNKAAYFDYLQWAERNVRSGGLIIADNVFLGGGVWGGSDERFSEKQVQIMRKFNQRLMDKDFYQSCFIPSQEGLLVAIKQF